MTDRKLQAMLILICALWARNCQAQANQLAVQLEGMHLHKLDETPVSIGLRWNHRLYRLFESDAAVGYAGKTSGNHFRVTTALLGVRSGKLFQRLALFVTARAGAIHFANGLQSRELDRRTHGMVQIRGNLEIYTARRTFLSIDLGDSVVYYGAARIMDRPNPDALGTVHNFQPGIGFGIRF